MEDVLFPHFAFAQRCRPTSKKSAGWLNVAMTRAEKYLYVTHAVNAEYMAKNCIEPSQFLE